MKVSIITPTFNSANTIQSNLDSIKAQSFKDYQLIIIDNNSTDKTIEIIKKNNISNIKFLIEKDLGIFDAINKGIKLSDNELISVLHSDDFYNDENVLKNVVETFQKNKDTDIVYGNLIYVKKNNIDITLRCWKPGMYDKNSFFKGWHPPHPSFFAKKKLFKDYGHYNLKNGNSADVELMFRFLNIYNVKSEYLNKTLVKMRYGGASNKDIFSIIKQNIQIIKFLKINRNYYKIGIFILYKFLDRIKQFVIKE
jgi:glycosyltransferase involved in cell wall biosynthesis